MERRHENLLTQLESEGIAIAKCRKQLYDLKHSNTMVDYSRIVHIQDELNKHISSFDKIDYQLNALEAVI